jgi:hypothetical protein
MISCFSNSRISITRWPSGFRRLVVSSLWQPKNARFFDPSDARLDLASQLRSQFEQF